MTPVALSPQAARDIESIGDYIARDNPGRAATFVRELRQRCADIGHMPQAYPRVPGSQGLRRVVHGRYLIFYRAAGGAARVERVLHGARDYGGLL